MAKVHLKFGQSVLKTFDLPDGASLKIGRMPDNDVQIDNLAVSGHHARIHWDTDHFVIEDNNSLNGVWIAGKRVPKATLYHGEVVLIGKHSLGFEDEARRNVPRPAVGETHVEAAGMQTIQETVVLGSKEGKQQLAKRIEGADGGELPAPMRTPVGVLTVVEGKTDQDHYMLSDDLNVIGKSDMASIRLKGWFAPKVAAVVNRREGKYFVAPSEKDVKLKINGEDVSAQQAINDGDTLEVAGVKMAFSLAE
ncbi:MAG TPA: FHA domain-containing protein [Terriglobales bacterium]|jgi:pSer/pThr/pTyr-binding forkhead associated (FHA) protein|nr:FHA domain-containing protein [Terriglobales bacterium]